MENPFFFGKSVIRPAFINRDKEIKEISSQLSRGQSIILFSPRRYGKTSLIKIVLDKIKKNNIITFYFDLYRIVTIEKFSEYFCEIIISNLKSKGHKLFEQVRNILPSFSPKLVYSEPNTPTIELDISTLKKDKSKSLRELFDAVEIFSKKRQKKACIVFDEFQEILNIDGGEELEKEMRSAFQHHQNVSYVFMGSKSHLMNELFNVKNRPFYHFGLHYELTVIESHIWEKFIYEIFNKGNYKIKKSHCKMLTSITKGHPFYTQMLCSELWNLNHNSKNITDKKILIALDRVIDREEYGFVQLWDQLDTKSRRILSAIAIEGHSELFSAHFLEKYNLKSHSSIQRTVKKLLQMDIIIKIKSGFDIIDPIYSAWIKKNIKG